MKSMIPRYYLSSFSSSLLVCSGLSTKLGPRNTGNTIQAVLKLIGLPSDAHMDEITVTITMRKSDGHDRSDHVLSTIVNSKSCVYKGTNDSEEQGIISEACDFLSISAVVFEN